MFRSSSDNPSKTVPKGSLHRSRLKLRENELLFIDLWSFFISIYLIFVYTIWIFYMIYEMDVEKRNLDAGWASASEAEQGDTMNISAQSSTSRVVRWAKTLSVETGGIQRVTEEERRQLGSMTHVWNACTFWYVDCILHYSRFPYLLNSSPSKPLTIGLS